MERGLQLFQQIKGKYKKLKNCSKRQIDERPKNTLNTTSSYVYCQRILPPRVTQCYARLLESGSQDVWTRVPEYFIEQQDAFKAECNPLLGFLHSRTCKSPGSNLRYADIRTVSPRPVPRN